MAKRERDRTRSIHKLSGTDVNRKKPGMLSDGGGLWLQIGDGAKRSWIFRYKRLTPDPAGQRGERYMGLGSFKDMTLSEAREEARKCRVMRQNGLDPIETREAERTARALADRRSETFKEAAELYVTTHSASWKNAKHLAQWRATLEDYAYPVIGSLPVEKITPDHVLDILRPIWSSKAETAKRLRGRIEQVWDASKARHKFTGDNPAAWKGNLKPQLPNLSKVRKVKHHPALPYQRIGEFMASLRERVGPAARVLELIVLSGLRLKSCAGIRGREVDLAARKWTVPGDRMKGGEEHTVPLPDQLVAFLRMWMPRDPDALMFPGTTGRPVTDTALKKLRQRMGYGDATTHGFRSTFRTWVSEQTSFPDAVAEAAIAHKIGDAVIAAYNRTTFYEKRAELMKHWATFCDRIATTDAKVIPLARA